MGGHDGQQASQTWLYRALKADAFRAAYFSVFVFGLAQSALNDATVTGLLGPANTFGKPEHVDEILLVCKLIFAFAVIAMVGHQILIYRDIESLYERQATGDEPTAAAPSSPPGGASAPCSGKCAPWREIAWRTCCTFINEKSAEQSAALAKASTDYLSPMLNSKWHWLLLYANTALLLLISGKAATAFSGALSFPPIDHHGWLFQTQMLAASLFCIYLGLALRNIWAMKMLAGGWWNAAKFTWTTEPDKAIFKRIFVFEFFGFLTVFCFLLYVARFGQQYTGYAFILTAIFGVVFGACFVYAWRRIWHSMRQLFGPLLVFVVVFSALACVVRLGAVHVMR